MMADHEHADGAATGFTCPRCGGALWRTDRDGELHFECRIGDALSAAELWIEHCAVRNQALKRAVRVLAENAALGRALESWARQRGNTSAATRITAEAADNERLRAAIWQMLEGLSEPRAFVDAEQNP